MADEIVSGLRGIKKELKDVQDRMVGLSAGSDEFVKLSLRAGELRDKMKDVKEAVNSNAGPAIESFGNNLGIAQGQLMSLDLEGFGDSMKRMAGNVKAVDFKTFKDGISNIGDGLASLGKALISNPIFWIAGAIAGAVAAINYFSEKEAERIKAIEEKRQQDLANYKKDNELRIVQANGAAEKVYAIRMEELKREQGYHWAILMTAKESHDKQIALSDEWKEKEKASQQKYNELRIEMEKLTQERLNALTAKRADIDKQFNLVGLTERQKTNKLLKEEYDEALRQIAALGGSAEDVAKISAIYREKQRKIDEANAKEDKAKGVEKTNKLEEDKNFEISIKNEIAEATKKKEDYELQVLESSYETKKKEAKKHHTDLTLIDEWYEAQKSKLKKEKEKEEFERKEREKNLLKQIKYEEIAQEEQLSQEIQNIKQGTLQTDIQNIKDNYNEKIEYAKKYNLEYEYLEKQREKEIAEKQKENNRKEIEKKLALENAKYDIAKQYLTAAQSLTDAMTTTGLLSAKKSFEVGKAISMAQTTISTIQGVQNALNAVSTIPEPFGMALKVANAVAIGAAGAANIAKIAKTQFDGGTTPPNQITMPSPTGGAMGGGGGQSPAALNLSGIQGNINAAPLQTYVLAGQVSNAQQAEFKIKNTASILGGG